MKKIAFLAIGVALAWASASAQYTSLEKGTVYTFKETATEDGKTESTEYKSTIVDVTEANGITTVVYEDVHKIPGNDFAEFKQKHSFTYNAADGMTTSIPLAGEEYKQTIINSLVEGAQAQGQVVSESDIAELEKQFKVKGDIMIPLPAQATAGEKIANCTVKLSMGPQTMSVSLWEAQYAGYEDVEVPAGKFENCLKITYVMKMNSAEGVEKQYVTAWYAKNVGGVKEQVADKKGNVQQTNELIAIEK